jgi:hypothetical protein
VIEGGLMLFSDFIKAPKKDNLYKLILQSISFYSFTLSIQDFHLRISLLIMIVEGLLLEENYVKEMEKKAKNRLCKLMFRQNSKEFIGLNNVMTSIYKVRHQMTHKGNRIPIPINNFRYLQIILVEFLKKLIVLNQTLKNKTELITYIDTLS